MMIVSERKNIILGFIMFVVSLLHIQLLFWGILLKEILKSFFLDILEKVVRGGGSHFIPSRELTKTDSPIQE